MTTLVSMTGAAGVVASGLTSAATGLAAGGGVAAAGGGEAGTTAERDDGVGSWAEAGLETKNRLAQDTTAAAAQRERAEGIMNFESTVMDKPGDATLKFGGVPSSDGSAGSRLRFIFLELIGLPRFNAHATTRTVPGEEMMPFRADAE